MYNCHLKVDSFEKIFGIEDSQSQNEAVKAATHHSLYSNKISGIVLYVREKDLLNYGKNNQVNSGIGF
jgi:hypothetical protein